MPNPNPGKTHLYVGAPDVDGSVFERVLNTDENHSLCIHFSLDPQRLAQLDNFGFTPADGVSDECKSDTFCNLPTRDGGTLAEENLWLRHQAGAWRLKVVETEIIKTRGMPCELLRIEQDLQEDADIISELAKRTGRQEAKVSDYIDTVIASYSYVRRHYQSANSWCKNMHVDEQRIGGKFYMIATLELNQGVDPRQALASIHTLGGRIPAHSKVLQAIALIRQDLLKKLQEQKIVADGGQSLATTYTAPLFEHTPLVSVEEEISRRLQEQDDDEDDADWDTLLVGNS